MDNIVADIKFTEDDYTSCFFVNAGAVVLVWLTLSAIFILSKFGIFILQKFTISFLGADLKSQGKFKRKAMIIGYKVQRYFMRAFLTI